MPVREIIKLKDVTDEEKRLSFLLAIHCAPVLSRIKAANMVTVTQNEYIGIKYILRGTDISCRFLKTGKDRGLLYLYWEKKLRSYLYLKEIVIFLEEYGYLSKDLDKMLGYLEKRIDCYCRGGIAFPHEIGVFLEYPLNDVTGFLENKGKNFIYSGYWKVYHDVQGAVRKFKQYDTERYRMVRAVASGQNIQEIMKDSAS